MIWDILKDLPKERSQEMKVHSICFSWSVHLDVAAGSKPSRPRKKCDWLVFVLIPSGKSGVRTPYHLYAASPCSVLAILRNGFMPFYARREALLHPIAPSVFGWTLHQVSDSSSSSHVCHVWSVCQGFLGLCTAPHAAATLSVEHGGVHHSMEPDQSKHVKSTWMNSARYPWS